MFSDPYLLEKDDRATLVQQLRESVAQFPSVSELRVLLGMALCVNFEVQAAIEELRESVRLAPDSFIAQLKLGELWMRLRVLDKAEEHTRLGALLAQNIAQSEMARRQAAALRAMKRDGIERGGYGTPFQRLLSSLRRVWTRRRSEPAVALDLS
jgi:cytochrome c-type biogenesis protein CcmH/NrfG